MKLLTALWMDESGLILSAELALVATIGVLGLSVALVSVRDSIAAELTDLSDAFRSLDQSYGFGGMRGCQTHHGYSSFSAGSRYLDSTLREAGSEQDIIVADYVVCSNRPALSTPVPAISPPSVVLPCPCGRPNCNLPQCKECPQEITHPCPPPLIVPDAGFSGSHGHSGSAIISPVPEGGTMAVPCEQCPSGVNPPSIILPAPELGLASPHGPGFSISRDWGRQGCGQSIPVMPAGPLQVW